MKIESTFLMDNFEKFQTQQSKDPDSDRGPPVEYPWNIYFNLDKLT